MKAHHPAITLAAPNGTSPGVPDLTIVRDVRGVQNLDNLFVQSPKLQISQRQFRSDFLFHEGHHLLAVVDAARLSELNKVLREMLFLKCRVETCFGPPHAFFEPDEFCSVFFRDCGLRH